MRLEPTLTPSLPPPAARGRVGRGTAGPVLFVFGSIDAYFAALAKTAAASLGPRASRPPFLHQAKKRAGRPRSQGARAKHERPAQGARRSVEIQGRAKCTRPNLREISSPAGSD